MLCSPGARLPCATFGLRLSYLQSLLPPEADLFMQKQRRRRKADMMRGLSSAGLPLGEPVATQSILVSVMEKRISWTYLYEEFVRRGQRVMLVGLQRNFLRQHDVACDEITFGRKAPTNTWTAGAVELVDVHRGAVANPVSLSAMAAGDLKIACRVILRELLRR